MLRDNRVIFKNNTTLTDLSQNLNNFLSGTEVVDFVAAEDAIYIGSDLPFNHRWFEVSVVNAIASVVSVSIWDGNGWQAAVDVVDETQGTSGTTLSRSGIISWSPDKLKDWAVEETTEDIPDLATLKIYNMFWVKITLSADVTPAMALKYVGHKFSNDERLVSEYPELNRTALKSAYAAGKTTWNDQAFSAAEYIIDDLRSFGVIWSKNQILDWRQFEKASIHKTAEIIYRGMGDDYKDNLLEANKSYRSAMAIKNFKIDSNQNGKLEGSEQKNVQGWLTR